MSGILTYWDADPEVCPFCDATKKQGFRFIYDDYDYDGNDRVHTYNRYHCDACDRSIIKATNNPYEDEKYE
jgi:hypothetical protein